MKSIKVVYCDDDDLCRSNYRCPKCEYDSILNGMKYCPGCGLKIIEFLNRCNKTITIDDMDFTCIHEENHTDKLHKIKTWDGEYKEFGDDEK